MNKELMKVRKQELAQRGLAAWGRIAPELFTFGNRDGRRAAGRG